MAAKSLAELLGAANGSIVFFSTVAANKGFPNHSIIAAAKSGIEGLTRSLAAELAPHVRVNCIAPSLTKTPLSSQLLSNDTVAKAIAAAHPLGRLGEAEDIAQAAAFLLSDASSWITGQIVSVDGGRGALDRR